MYRDSFAIMRNEEFAFSSGVREQFRITDPFDTGLVSSFKIDFRQSSEHTADDIIVEILIG